MNKMLTDSEKDKQKEKQRKKRARRLYDGKCVRCGKRDHLPGITFCEICSAKYAKKRNEKRQEQEEAKQKALARGVTLDEIVTRLLRDMEQVIRIGADNGSGYFFAGTVTELVESYRVMQFGIDCKVQDETPKPLKDRIVLDVFSSALESAIVIMVEGKESGKYSGLWDRMSGSTPEKPFTFGIPMIKGDPYLC